MKTKPTQQSVGKLREIGIQPDILVCRTEQVDDHVRWAQRSALFCNVPLEAVIEERDVDFSIYEVPVEPGEAPDSTRTNRATSSSLP